MVNLIRGIFAAFIVAQSAMMGKDYIDFSKSGKNENHGWIKSGITGLLGNFFDTLGVSSFAVIIAMKNILKLDIEDRQIPAMLNISCAIPNIVEALIFITVVDVDRGTLIPMLVAAGAGSYIGAGITSKLDERKIQAAMGIALFITASVIFMGLPWINLLPVGGNATGLTGIKLVVAILLNFIYGSLMTAGIGLYAPCMATTYILGMSPECAFPIMMGSCAVLMPIASIRFIKEGNSPRKASIAISIGGVIGVIIAATVFSYMPMNAIKVLCVFVIYYTSVSMIKKSISSADKVSIREI